MAAGVNRTTTGITVAFANDGPHDIHVLPDFEGERQHETSVDCWCRPVRDIRERRVVVHNRVAEA